MSNIHIFSFNLFQEHTMIAWNAGPGCIIVDPAFYDGNEAREFYGFLSDKCLEPEAILITHAHFDHVAGAAEVQRKYDIPVYMDPREQLSLNYHTEMVPKFGLRLPDISFRTTDISEGDVLRHAGFNLEVISTPGHAPGATCYLDRGNRMMFTGDTLFAGTIGRTDLDPYGDYDVLIESIMQKLVVLDGDITIYPGHGPSSTIGRERTHNPFLEPFNEPEEEPDPDARPVFISNRQ